jgi:hypothetical protein
LLLALSIMGCMKVAAGCGGQAISSASIRSPVRGGREMWPWAAAAASTSDFLARQEFVQRAPVLVC